MKKYDFVVFGATGFTGQFIVEELKKIQQNENKQFTWAVAGRSLQKLRKIVGHKTDDVIIADVNDKTSLDAMCLKTTVLLNAVGPYRFYGEQVVRACLDNNTHYVDITGEPQFVETMQLKYDEIAKQKEVLIVNCCGFDSIPADIGTLFTSSLFKKCYLIESFLTLHAPKGLGGHYATYESAVYGFGNQNELRMLREKKKINSITFGKKQRHKPLFKRKTQPYYETRLGRWAVPFPGSDASVVRYSQKQLQKQTGGKSQPVDYFAYFTVGSFFYLLLFLFFGTIFSVLAKFRIGRYLLLNFPYLFSFGLFSHEGPTNEQLKSTSFEMVFYAKGEKEQSTPTTSTSVVVQLTGPEPGYIATPICLVQSALVILEERDKLQVRGGVLTPAVAFSKSTIIERLQKHGLQFSVVRSIPS